MKLIIKRLTILLFLTILLIFTFKFKDIVTLSTLNSFELWLHKLFPSLFIMFIINDLIINTNAYYYLIKILEPIFKKLFHLNGESIVAFILSIFSGTPANAFIIKELIEVNKITIHEANHLLMFTYFSNPLFLYSILSSIFPTNIVFKLIFIHYISNIIIILITRENEKKDKFNFKFNEINFLSCLEKSIKKSINTLLMILGSVTFFMIISNLIIKILNLNDLNSIMIKGLFEITQALNEINSLKILETFKELITLSIISFGGLSIHMQVFSIISDTNINYKYFLKGRIYHVLISIILLLISFII